MAKKISLHFRCQRSRQIIALEKYENKYVLQTVSPVVQMALILQIFIVKSFCNFFADFRALYYVLLL